MKKFFCKIWGYILFGVAKFLDVLFGGLIKLFSFLVEKTKNIRQLFYPVFGCLVLFLFINPFTLLLFTRLWIFIPLAILLIFPMLGTGFVSFLNYWKYAVCTYLYDRSTFYIQDIGTKRTFASYKEEYYRKKEEAEEAAREKRKREQQEQWSKVFEEFFRNFQSGGYTNFGGGQGKTELIVIAARPGMGKTAFALNVATFAASNKKTVAIFNLEMNAEQLATRMISSLGQIPLNKLRTGKLEHSDWKRVNEAISQLADANIYIDDTPGITVGEIKSKCRRLSSMPEGLDLVVIDYLQLVSTGSHFLGNRQQEVSEISRSLKTMALELNIPVISVAQLSREVEKRDDKRPLMSDLRESGSIEQDADIVAFLYREDYYNKEARSDDYTSESEFIINKNRSGPTGSIDLLFKRNTGTFLNYKKEDKEE